MNKIKKIETFLLLIIFMIAKYMLHRTQVANIVMTLFGIALTYIHFSFFDYLMDDLKIGTKKYILISVVLTNIITTIINASAYFSDLVIFSKTFMIIVILAKILFLISCFKLLNRSFNEENVKYIPITIGLLILAFLSFVEILLNIEAIIELIIVIYYMYISKIKKKKNN